MHYCAGCRANAVLRGDNMGSAAISVSNWIGELLEENGALDTTAAPLDPA